ncbi:hypothetical protein ACN28S_09200 [Cystobacter fuscus]
MAKKWNLDDMPLFGRALDLLWEFILVNGEDAKDGFGRAVLLYDVAVGCIAVLVFPEKELLLDAHDSFSDFIGRLRCSASI